ncbi:MAG: S41 family peptidase [Bacteroidetes bacterium]|nr:S41 family peptidase [Bacteroidota bacterium]
MLHLLKIKKWLVAFSLPLAFFVQAQDPSPRSSALPLKTNYTPDYFEISKNLEIFNAVYRELNVSYVDGTKPGQLMKTGIEAMLMSLDPYTNYYTENDIEDFRIMTTGEYSGIGISVNDINKKIIFADPAEGFAAFKAGIRAGDQLVGINGVSVEGKRTDEIGPLLKGQAGTPVKLKIIKAGQTTPTELSFIREEIKSKAVPYSGILPNGETGYIKLVSFTENCSGEVKDALLTLKGKGCKNLVLDLRGNLGGLLHEAVNIVNFFIEKGQEVVFTKGKVSDWDKTYTAMNNPIDTQIPLVVLVDENSASASEIVSGALQDLDRAVIIGKRTYGKGLVQQTKDLAYNSKIKITVAKYYIPSGRCVQALDYSNKNEEGRVEKVPDSLITAFKTKGGRVVYDGAGVMPDVKTPEENLSNVLISLISKFHVFNYATRYYLAHPQISPVQEFKLSDAEFSEFITYLKDKDYSYKTRSEVELLELKNNAEKEKYYNDIKAEYEALFAKMNANKKDDLVKHGPEIKKYLEEEIAARYYFQTGRIEFSLKNDNDLKEAVRLVSDNNKVKIILTTTEKAIKPFNIKKRF